MVFVELPLFGKYLQFTDEELTAIQEAILEDPLRGDVIPGGVDYANFALQSLAGESVVALASSITCGMSAIVAI